MKCSIFYLPVSNQMRKDNVIQIQEFTSPVGELLLGSYEGKLCLCDWRYRKMRDAIDKRLQKGLDAVFVEETSAIVEKVKIQLNEYFDGIRQQFDVPVIFSGTDFQNKIWSLLQEIPFGATESYLSLSRSLGNEKAIRAVAAANGANALSIIVPCHRIIGSDGSLTGYAGGIQAKKKLLALEKRSDEQLVLFSE